MPRRIELCESLFESGCCNGHRRDDHLPTLDRDANPLIDAEMSRTRHRRRQTDTETVSPLLDIENCHGHDLLPR
jgi:hypothetical protein